MDTTDDTTDTDTEQPERLALPSLDSFKAVNNLVALAIDPRAVKRHLRQLHDALAAIDAAQRKLDADRAAHDEQLVKDRAEISADRAKLNADRTAFKAEKDDRADSLAERFARIRELEKAWSALRLPGEDVFPAFGGLTRAPPPVSPLQKARFFSKHGRLPHVDESLDAPVAASEPPAEQLHRGNTGESYPPGVTLTREPEQPVRVRGRRGAAHV